MARPIWTGALSFGLVNVAVALHAATRDRTPRFHRLDRDSSVRIRNKRVREDTGEEVAYENIVRGYDVGRGQVVTVTDEELAEVEPGRSGTIEILDFVDQAQIDPVFYQRTYYLAPRDEAAHRPYALLLRALREADRVGVATFVLRSRQYLAAIRPEAEVLALETMFFADEIRDPAQEIGALPSEAPGGKELETARKLIDSMTTDWDPGNYRDTHREAVLALVEAKRQGEEIVADRTQPEEGEVVDLMEALERSLRSTGGRGSGRAHQGADGPTRPDDDGGASAGDPSRLTREELYERAQALRIPGRSKMSRAELEHAVDGGAPGRAS
ncbi:MAG TPA: Ku protein [Acidimicrobiales bacterium]|nr:Ku protein [Acidimicrobiales bacterium]